MGVRTKIVKWGNSHAVRIPKAVLRRAALREGEVLDIHLENGRICLKPALTLKSLVGQITPDNRYDEQDWGGLVGKEVW